MTEGGADPVFVFHFLGVIDFLEIEEVFGGEADLLLETAEVRVVSAQAEPLGRPVS